ncbi:MAG: PEP-CTERM/exosortase system-associated acyltransferase [Alteromonas stellipolaris]|uniref:PEP-CTERM/exosortase system-associated acyltransferase n=1 Tax=Alteromonas stellipolaris TaxID=233316 RepID=UPI003B8E2C92
MQKRKLISTIQTIFGKKSRISKALSGYQKLQEVREISSHFSAYLTPLIANNKDLKEQSYGIRHQVYCVEEGFEPERESKLEIDEFDAYSTACMIEHKKTHRFAGTVRLVRPQKEDELLPIEKYCPSSITHPELNPANFKRSEICEVSRLAVPEEFRRRKSDKFDGASTGVINTSTYSETELRCFPFIAIGLYLAAASISINSGIKHTYVMMEPRLARSMRFIGIKFEQIGPVVDYHGKRAAYYITPEMLHKNLPKGFAAMFKHIQASLGHNVENNDISAKNADRIVEFIYRSFSTNFIRQQNQQLK